MRAFAEHLETCERCQSLEELPLSEAEKSAAQFECFRDSYADRVDRAHEEWKDRQLKAGRK